MKDWFKARNIWGAAIAALSDEEAGRLAKAIWSYTMDGEIVELEGAGKGIFAMILITLQQDAERDGEISEKRAIAGRKGAENTNSGKNRQMPANDSNCQQLISNADNKNKNKNKNIEQESELIVAHEIQKDHDTVIDAAEDAGFKMSNSVRAALIALYADFGLTKVLDGIKSCSEHGAANLAYLRACMKDTPKKGKTVAAQQYSQRDYSGEQEEAMLRMIRGAV